MGYSLPVEKRKARTPGKTPLVLVACGSFSPITVLHTQLFAMAQKHIRDSTDFCVVASYLSPVSDAYKKTDLASAPDRLRMCELAAEGTDIMVDSWEAEQVDAATGEPVYTTTVDVMRHIDREINGDSDSASSDSSSPQGEEARIRVALLIGADVAVTMGDLQVWPREDLDVIVGHYGVFVVERPMHANRASALEPLKGYDKVWVVEAFENDVSSTKIRAQLRGGQRVLDLPGAVYSYIRQHRLYGCN